MERWKEQQSIMKKKTKNPEGYISRMTDCSVASGRKLLLPVVYAVWSWFKWVGKTIACGRGRTLSSQAQIRFTLTLTRQSWQIWTFWTWRGWKPASYIKYIYSGLNCGPKAPPPKKKFLNSVHFRDILYKTNKLFWNLQDGCVKLVAFIVLSVTITNILTTTHSFKELVLLHGSVQIW